MLRFYTANDLGNIKSIDCALGEIDDDEKSDWKFVERTVAGNSTGDRSLGVQKLAISSTSERSVLAAARCSGTVSSYTIDDEGGLGVLEEWKDPRFKIGHSFVGMEYDVQSRLMWCTSNGALGRKTLNDPKIEKASLPMRLCSWKLSPTSETFAYGGNEVDLSVWDIERAFQSPSTSNDQASTSAATPKKRKRGGDLLPAEVWRVKNLPNDSLSLRQPIHITSLTYLKNTTATSCHLATGTERGDVRRYDTRSAKRPVADWKGVAKIGGVKAIQTGSHEHELFVSDCGTNLSTLDLRNGRVLYSYRKLSGAINCMTSSASSPGFLASTSHDRYFRLHSTYAPPASEKANQEQRGEVLGSIYLKSTPTAVVYGTNLTVVNDDERAEDVAPSDEDSDGEDVWAGMEEVEDSENEKQSKRKRQNKK